MSQLKTVILIVFFVLLAAGAAWAENQEQAGNKKADITEGPGIFDSEGALDISLEYDIKKFKGDKGPSRTYHPAKLTYTEPDGRKIAMDVQIKARGKLRRQLLKCLVPSFKMKFDPSQTGKTIFRNQEKLKLVLHCKSKPKFYQNYYLQEYLIYKAYNILTEKSFRVRLARITYVDSKKKMKPFTAYGFFIESYRQLAQRNNGNTVDATSIIIPQTHLDTSRLVSIFQYMIGNTDWSIRSVHNTKLITIGDSKKYYPVPFDFDQAGLIDAHYARPDLQLPIKSVRERLFRGFSRKEEDFKQTFAIYEKHKAEILGVFRNFSLLPEKIRKRNIKYIEGFYKIIGDPKLVKRYFIDNYRGRPFPLR